MTPTTDCPKISISQINRKSNSLTIDGVINNKNHIVTLDTGASNSIIRYDLVKEPIEPLIGIKLTTATGEEAPIVGKITLQITVGNAVFNHEFIVAKIVDEIILGVDFMVKHGVTLDMKNKILRYNNMEIILNIGYENSSTSREVKVLKGRTIPPNSEAVVLAKIEGDCGKNKLWVVEGNNKMSGNENKSIIVSQSLVENKKNQYIPVRVLNHTNKAKTLRKGETIGKCETVSAIVDCEQHQQSIESEMTTNNEEHKRTFSKWMEEMESHQKNKARKLLNRFSSLFTSTNGQEGRTQVVKHRIDTGNAEPIKQAPRRVPLAKRGEVEQLIKEMAQNQVIQQSTSPWSSPVVLVKKKDGSTRFCVDYRKLNEVTKKDSYPLPRIDDSLDTLAGAKWFSTLDLKSGYWQVEIEDKDKEKTAFSAGDGLWQFSVMPFGLCNAPATFERLMEHVLRGLQWKTCLIYLDDIIVMGKDMDDHLKNLEEVFERIQGAGLKLNLKKCELFRQEVKFLGHKITTEGVHTDEDKITAVKEWPAPKNIHELRSFLGLCTYYRRFVPNFANVASSLHNLTRKNQVYHWKEEHEVAFQQLKKLLCEAPILTYPIPESKFILDTDASNQGIGGVLSQEINGQEKVVAYFSKIMKKPERNYCVTRKELLAVVESVKHFHKYLYGQKFLLRTDHAALKWLLQFKNPEGQIARWIERLQNYDFSIEHRKGRLHSNADALSRRPCKLECKHCSKTEDKEGVIDIRLLRALPQDEWTDEQIGKKQLEDEDLRKIIKWKEQNRKPTWQQITCESPTTKAYYMQWKSLKLEHSIM